ncbi:3-methyl-2-oxobutanoate hydroxymethyltransferase [bioreactor metagenome]|uniref:3-methyl-2-oxobutanoate hydroxymethyltransferase n=1 Tax=bioreactor metagenome TaxID=1076179 RepID=A0A645FCZ9_9ZZZZ
MGHLGLTPQSINKFGSYRARGTKPDEAEKIIQEASRLDAAGVFAIVLEKIPAELAKQITENISVPTIGIGAGKYCDGQILVYSDMLGISVDFNPRFVRRYATLYDTIKNAVIHYSKDVVDSNFPNDNESY